MRTAHFEHYLMSMPHQIPMHVKIVFSYSIIYTHHRVKTINIMHKDMHHIPIPLGQMRTHDQLIISCYLAQSH